MLADFKGANKFVFDLSLVEPDAGVQRLVRLEDGFERFDLVLNCHVLEHMSDPLDGLKESVSLARSGGLVYIEVPNELWRGPHQFSFQEQWLTFVAKHPLILKWLDFMSTAMRIKTGWIPPFGFVAVREHINYFTLDALRALMRSASLIPVCCIEKDGVLMALGRKL
jgi:SAM-dependent methyltransferase